MALSGNNIRRRWLVTDETTYEHDSPVVAPYVGWHRNKTWQLCAVVHYELPGAGGGGALSHGQNPPCEPLHAVYVQKRRQNIDIRT